MKRLILCKYLAFSAARRPSSAVILLISSLAARRGNRFLWKCADSAVQKKTQKTRAQNEIKMQNKKNAVITAINVSFQKLEKNFVILAFHSRRDALHGAGENGGNVRKVFRCPDPVRLFLLSAQKAYARYLVSFASLFGRSKKAK